MLENRGWKIHRIWSTDWFNNREAEIRRLLQKVEQCIAESGGAVQNAPEESGFIREASRTAPLRTAGEPQLGTGREAEIPVFASRAATSVARREPPRVAETPKVSAPATSRRGLSISDARAKLLEFQNSTIQPNHPDVEKGILRKAMLGALLRNLPTTVEEFREFIPLGLREGTDPEQMKYLPQILEILETVET